MVHKKKVKNWTWIFGEHALPDAKKKKVKK